MQAAKNAESGSDTGLQSHGRELEDCLILLAARIEAQTEAIHSLAESNFALVQAMSESEGANEDSPRLDLSGKRIY